MVVETLPPATFGWRDDSVELTIEVDQAGTARIAHLGSGPPTEGGGGAGLPLVDVVVAGEGRGWSGRRYCESVAGRRLRYQGHSERAEPGGWHEVRVELADPVTGLVAEVFYRVLPVIFNDYMNTVNGDPTTERLMPLIAAAAEAGAEYFCIDAGWYAELGEGWWDTVGAWRPSVSRFPGGLAVVLDRIRELGMVPGLWLEPEVIGVRSPLASRLPDGAFSTRYGRRVAEQGRYHLDLRHPAAVAHLDETADFLAGELGIGYLKCDYNINVGPGTDAGGLGAGAGLLGHNRAYLDWLDGVLDRHPGLVIENCAPGGMRTDYALLARMQLQSTSDQQDHLRYPPIAAAAPAAITPEQAAVWADPQAAFTTDEIAFTLASAMLGRVHLSGHLDRMSPAQRALVAEAIRVYKQIRPAIARSVPFWPLGLPGWEDPWIALGIQGPEASYLTVWRREADGSPDRVRLPVPSLRGQRADARILFPEAVDAGASWDPAEGSVTVTLPRCPSACVVSLSGRR